VAGGTRHPARTAPDPGHCADVAVPAEDVPHTDRVQVAGSSAAVEPGAVELRAGTETDSFFIVPLSTRVVSRATTARSGDKVTGADRD